MTDLGNRAVACAGFRWMAGMLIHDPALGSQRIDDQSIRSRITFRGWVPDIDDPATRRCFAFGLLPEAWGPDATVNVWSDGSVAIETPDPGGMSRTGSGYDDVVAALEAAPVLDPHGLTGMRRRRPGLGEHGTTHLHERDIMSAPMSAPMGAERLLNVRADIEDGSECTGPLTQVEADWLLSDRDHYAAEVDKLQFIINTLNSRMARNGALLSTAQSERDALQARVAESRLSWDKAWQLLESMRGFEARAVTDDSDEHRAWFSLVCMSDEFGT